MSEETPPSPGEKPAGLPGWLILLLPWIAAAGIIAAHALGIVGWMERSIPFRIVRIMNRNAFLGLLLLDVGTAAWWAYRAALRAKLTGRKFWVLVLVWTCAISAGQIFLAVGIFFIGCLVAVKRP